MNVELFWAAVWAMDPETHAEHVEILGDYDPEYCYNAILWIKCVWEKDTKNPEYLRVLQGRGDLARMRADIKAQGPFLRRLVDAFRNR